jgi:hypothetical protein
MGPEAKIHEFSARDALPHLVYPHNNFDSERSDLFRQNFGEAFDGPLGRLIGAESGCSEPASDGGDLNDVSGALFAK